VPPSRHDRPLDLVVYGATSFVGQLVTAHLVRRHGDVGPLRWAIAGRSAEKLATVAAALGTGVEHIVADAADGDALAAMTDRTKVVVSTVGPYALHGSELVAAAVAAGTDYCDLTGEPQWMRRMIDAHHAGAEATGARVVHSCGFDSIPSDLGVWFTQQRAIEALGEPCEQIGMRVTSMRGGASGGTLASMVNVLEEAARDPELKTMLADPYALVPAGSRPDIDQPEVTRPRVDPSSGQWIAPFVMATINTKVVHRSHALLGHPWGEGFRYDEAMAMGTGPLDAVKAAGLAAGLGAGMGLASLGPARSVIGRIMPKPGTGPSPKAQEAGSFTVRFRGRTADGRTIETEVTGDRDPGYGSTAKMLGEVAVSLVGLDPARTPGGFHTPSTAFGDPLVDRLRDHAGLTFEVV
jgi:short subunit dehydrogenase-like uncharacterized protein